MPTAQYKLKTITPWFLNGPDPRSPELRAASVRGQLRYWFRAIEGARTADLQQLWRLESNIFGSTGGGSAVSIRVYPRELPTERTAMLPHKVNDRERSYQQAIEPGQDVLLEAVTRPGVKFSLSFRNAVEVWLLLGGIGKRSRRMFGALGDASFWDFENLSGPQDLVTKAQVRLEQIIQVNGTPARTIPSFPTLHPNHSWIVIGTQGTNDWNMMITTLFTSLLRNAKYRPNERCFGYATGGRRASPLIAQVRKIGHSYYPILTVMRSTPARDIRWQVLNNFMEDASQLWQGVTVWGGPLQ